MLTVTVSSLVDDSISSHEQVSLFGDENDGARHENIEFAVDKIRKKFGRDAMKKGSFLNKDFSLRDKEE